MKYISGSVVIIDLGMSPFGHEQSGLRPAVFLSMQNNVALVIPLTSNTSALRRSGTISILATKQNGLDTTSIALVFQMRAVDIRRIIKSIGVLGSKEKKLINKILRTITTI